MVHRIQDSVYMLPGRTMTEQSLCPSKHGDGTRPTATPPLRSTTSAMPTPVAQVLASGLANDLARLTLHSDIDTSNNNNSTCITSKENDGAQRGNDKEEEEESTHPNSHHLHLSPVLEITLAFCSRAHPIDAYIPSAARTSFFTTSTSPSHILAPAQGSSSSLEESGTTTTTTTTSSSSGDDDIGLGAWETLPQSLTGWAVAALALLRGRFPRHRDEWEAARTQCVDMLVRCDDDDDDDDATTGGEESGPCESVREEARTADFAEDGAGGGRGRGGWRGVDQSVQTATDADGDGDIDGEGICGGLSQSQADSSLVASLQRELHAERRANRARFIEFQAGLLCLKQGDLVGAETHLGMMEFGHSLQVGGEEEEGEGQDSAGDETERWQVRTCT